MGKMTRFEMLSRNKKQTGSAVAARRGFTLVEVIVVAVIVLILAAVAIPMYSGYVKQARQDAVDNLAETIAASANAYWRRTSSNPSLNSLNIHYDENKHSVTINSSSVVVTDKNHVTANRSVSFK